MTSWPWPQIRRRNGRRLSEVEEKLQINVRDDLAANLGGDFLVSLDGPVLPTPSWKAVIEVHDSAQSGADPGATGAGHSQQAHGRSTHVIAIEPSEVGAPAFLCRSRHRPSGTTVAQYTFADGYMIVAPKRALLIEALHTHASGNSLARSAAFNALCCRKTQMRTTRPSPIRI